MKRYLLYNNNGVITQLVQCLEEEIGFYNSAYIETDLTELDWHNKDYIVIDGVLVVEDKISVRYKLAKLNKEYEEAMSNLTIGIPVSEQKTWTEQKNEAQAWLNDNTIATPLLDSILLSRGDTKEYLVSKIIEKSNLYTEAIGRLTGERQKKEKQILGI